MGGGLMKIGEVADLTHLSLRTIRHYEEVGVVIPSARSRGGFRLYTDADVDRLRLVRRMKPLDLTLDQVRDLLSALDALDAPDDAATGPGLDAVADRVRMYLEVAVARERTLREETALVRGVAEELRARIARRPTRSGAPATNGTEHRRDR